MQHDIGQKYLLTKASKPSFLIVCCGHLENHKVASMAYKGIGFVTIEIKSKKILA